MSESIARDREELLKLIRGPISREPTLPKPTLPDKVFLSYVVTESNKYVVEELVDRFLTTLGFETVYYNKNFVPGQPAHQVISDLIDKCSILVAFFTNETQEGDHWVTGGNVPNEVGQAGHHHLIALREEDNRVPSNIWTAGHVVPQPFDRQKPAELLVLLLDAFKKKGLL